MLRHPLITRFISTEKETALHNSGEVTRKASDPQNARAVADEVGRALAHPLRVDILTVLHFGPASKSELAEKLHEPLSNVTHHMKALSRMNAIEVAYTRKVGNVPQDFWRAITTSAFEAEDLAELTLEEHQQLSRIIVQSIMAELLAALGGGLLAGDRYAATAWDRLMLDEQGYRDLNANTGTFFNRAYEIAAESAARSGSTGERLKPYIGAVMGFRQSRTEPNVTATVGHLAPHTPPS